MALIISLAGAGTASGQARKSEPTTREPTALYREMKTFFETPDYDAAKHYFEIKLPVNRSDVETKWSAALAQALGGTAEHAVEHGRVDVLAHDFAIEVDRFDKYHEGIGQAIHYREETGKQGIVALMVTRASADREKASYIEESLCMPNQLRLVLLFAEGGTDPAPAVKTAGTGSQQAKPAEPAKPPATPAGKAAGGKVNLNTATLEELMTIPGVGEVRARAIMAARPLQRLEDLQKVSGIGEKTYETIAGYATVGEPAAAAEPKKK